MELSFTSVELYEIFYRRMGSLEAEKLMEYIINNIENLKHQKLKQAEMRLIQLEKEWKQLEKGMGIFLIAVLLFVISYIWFA